MKALFPYSATTCDIVVRVSVNYLPEQSDPENDRWFWAYHIRIENAGKRSVQLISREWKIGDSFGCHHVVKGDGVIGEQPMIEPGSAFDYVSGCPLGTPSGFMEGQYYMKGEDGSVFTVAIPRFPLLAMAVSGSA